MLQNLESRRCNPEDPVDKVIVLAAQYAYMVRMIKKGSHYRKGALRTYENELCTKLIELLEIIGPLDREEDYIDVYVDFMARAYPDYDRAKASRRLHDRLLKFKPGSILVLQEPSVDSDWLDATNIQAYAVPMSQRVLGVEWLDNNISLVVRYTKDNISEPIPRAAGLQIPLDSKKTYTSEPKDIYALAEQLLEQIDQANIRQTFTPMDLARIRYLTSILRAAQLASDTTNNNATKGLISEFFIPLKSLADNHTREPLAPYIRQAAIDAINLLYSGV